MAEHEHPADIIDLPYAEDQELARIKMAPHSIEAEQSVLGGLLLDNNAWDAVAEHISARDLYRPDHRLIFRHMARLAEASKPLDPVTVSDALKASDELDNAGGFPYLLKLADGTPSIFNTVAYARVVRERAALRRLIQAAQTIADSGYNPEGRSSDALINEAEHRIMQVAAQGPKSGGPQPVGDLVTGAVNYIEELYNSGSDLTGLATGYKDLDRKTAGLQRSDLIIIAGRPSMGKTSFAMNIVEYAALHQKKPILVFSMEMPANQLMLRMLSSVGKIDQTLLRTGKLSKADWERLKNAVSKIKEMPLLIDDTAALSPAEIRSRVRRAVRTHGDLGMIMVDYLQLMRVAGFTEGRTAEFSEISRELKVIAREFECPLLALSQLNRGVEQRPNKRPHNADLRESGALEQDADVIMFIYRDEVYNEGSADKGVAEVIIGKQRNGPTGTCRLAFVGRYTRFETLAREEY